MFARIRFEEVHTNRIGDKVLRIRRHRSIFKTICGYFKKLKGQLHAL